MQMLYNLILRLLLPFIILRLFIKSYTNPDYRKYISERFGFRLPKIKHKNPLWIHTVSVGEFLSIRPLLEHLLSQEPNLNLWISCTTPTGRKQIKNFTNLYPDNVQYSYYPYDLPSITRRFFSHIQPRGLILMETEIWPNLLLTAQKFDCPALLINARLSKKSLRGYYRFARKLLQKPLKHLKINAQTRQDAKRFQKLSSYLQPEITPSLKFIAPNKPIPSLANFIPPSTFLWLAASTHAGEEEIILKTHCELIKKYPNLQLCIAPRHPERRNQIQALIKKYGFNSVLRSKNQTLPNNATKTIAILDTLGELSNAYASATVAFIGGSLVNHGGHNPLEAIHAGCPVIFGPSMYNFQYIRDILIKQPFAREVRKETIAINIENLLNRQKNEPAQKQIHQYNIKNITDVLFAHSKFIYKYIYIT
ncbi:3-deoxy-D-manno-octulosonic acid transferase [Suttonella ornithocola]|uniref:3-deoxy-D-manno-octulosonic acid transferase n=1 Tax=Suttonella ornithocola TaxID=279832 RepID=A0A380MRY4_9GAMM|nr:3-deoxy-D-manno-octulosonic acid transferase [Suttonella ornithocola]SUO94663.1 3-deoxy-D-manno-octulosonic-acid transferase [Suttonella ornithocola]